MLLSEENAFGIHIHMVPRIQYYLPLEVNILCEFLVTGNNNAPVSTHTLA